MNRADPDKAIARLVGLGELRVWSLIVTLFGDLARARGARLSGAVLGEVMARVGIRPEAMRVALHRLRRDGWIESERVGRASHYALTRHGCEEAAKAAGRIYAGAKAPPETWHLLIAPPSAPAERQLMEQEMVASAHSPISPGVYLGQGNAPAAAPGCLAISGTLGEVPGWVRAGLMDVREVADYARLEAALAEVEAMLGAAPALGKIDRAALRMLIVHGWRRILLRHGDLPDAFFPETCRIAASRALVQRLLARLPVPALTES